MHSKIFQITTDRHAEPVGEMDLPEWFIGGVADYVSEIPSDSADFEECVKALGKYLHIKITNNHFTVKPDTFDEYFEKQWATFRDLVTRLNNSMSFEEFKGPYSFDGMGQLLWRINYTYEDKFGYYVTNSPVADPIPINEWLRYYAKPGEMYFVKSVIDYHF